MAKAKFEYEVSSKDQTKKGTDSAVKNINSVSDATKSAAKVMKTALAGISFAAVIAGVKKVTEAYGEQELVEMRLATAAKNNPYLDESSVTALKNHAAALQKVTTFGDEAIIQQQAFLSTMNLTATEINGVLDAAVNLSATGMMSLDSAVKNIAKTYGGMTGELGEMIPAMKELTAEQLKAGEGVEFISKQYAGLAETMAQSQTGIFQQAKNIAGDIAETAGGIVRGIVVAMAGPNGTGGIVKVLNTIQAWFADNAIKIINFFIHLPDIAKITFQTIGKMITRLFSSDTLASIADGLMTAIIRGFSAGIKFIGNLFAVFFDQITEQGSLIGGGWGKRFVNTLTKSITGGNLPKWMKSILGIEGWEGWQPFDVQGASTVGEALKNALSGTVNELLSDKTVLNQYKNEAKEAVGLMYSAVVSPFEDIAGDFSDSLHTLLNAELPDNVKTAISPLLIALEDSTAASEKVAEEMGHVRMAGYGTTSAGGRPGAGQVGVGAAGFITPTTSAGGRPMGGLVDIFSAGGAGGTAGNPLVSAFASVANALGPFVNMIIDSIKNLSSVMILMDPMSAIIRAAMSILGPAINTVLSPLVGILTVIGQTLGAVLAPAVELLAPAIKAVGEIFVWLYNKIILPIGNGIITIFNAFAIGFADMMNQFIELANRLRAANNQIELMAVRSIDQGKLSAITYGDVTTTGEAAVGAGDGYSVTAGSSGASYTAGRTINQTVTIYTDVVTEGGARGLALMIRDEIRAAEALGA